MKKTKLNELSLIPCVPNTKIPATKNGFWDGKFNFNVDEYSKKGFNIGLAWILSSIIVIDCDVDEERGLNGLKSLEELENKLGKLPKTLTQSTPRGGRHYFFTNVGTINPIGKIGNDIDIKYRGHVLIEPSKIDGKPYKFIDGVNENGDFTIAHLPEPWLEFLNKPMQNTSGCVPTLTLRMPGTCNQRKPIEGDFWKMYQGCLFIKHCVDNATTLEEPLWHLFACVLNHFSNGEELFINYSQNYPDYNLLATKKKFQNASKYNVNCNTISGYFADCTKCPHNKER